MRHTGTRHIHLLSGMFGRKKNCFYCKLKKNCKYCGKYFRRIELQKKLFYSYFSKLIYFLTNFFRVERGKRTLPLTKIVGVLFVYAKANIYKCSHACVVVVSCACACTHARVPVSIVLYIYFHQLHFIIMRMVDCKLFVVYMKRQTVSSIAHIHMLHT